MKRNLLRRIIIMLCFVMLVFAMPSNTGYYGVIHAKASESGSVKKGLTLYEKGKYSAASKEFKKFEEKASEACVADMSDKMKKAYLKKVLKFQTFSEAMNNTKNSKYIWDYYLTDIDKDGQAELLIKYGSCEADCSIIIYQYSEGKVIKVKSISEADCVLYAYPDDNGFIKFAAHMGYETITLITLQKDTITEKEIGSRDVGSGNYTYLPYMLESHISSDGLSIDCSALK